MKKIQDALPKLSPREIEAIRDWIDDYLEDQLEPTDEVKSKLDQSHRDIAKISPLPRAMRSHSGLGRSLLAMPKGLPSIPKHSLPYK